MNPIKNSISSDDRNFPSGHSELAALIRGTDWSQTPLGPLDQWPQSLRATLGLCLGSGFPINIIWGPEHSQLYNDGYRIVCGDRHPESLGMDYKVCWASAWPVIDKAFEEALAGKTSFIENQRMFLFRNGFLEETFFTYSFSPIYDEDGDICGLFHPLTETTKVMVDERRSRAVRDLTARLADAESTEAVFDLSIQVLAQYQLDLPFVSLYRLDKTRSVYELVGNTGAARGLCISPPFLSAEKPGIWPLDDLLSRPGTHAVDNLTALLNGAACGPYEEIPETAFAVPIWREGASVPVALFLAGASARLPVDDAYRGFHERIAAELGAALTRASLAEEARERVALLESQAQFALLFEQSTAGIAETGCDGRLKRVNDRFCAILGRSREALVGQLAMDYVHPDDREENTRRLRELMVSGRAFETYNRYMLVDGSSVWVSKTVTPIRVPGSKEIDRILAVIIDATERNQAEAQLEAASRNKDEFLAMLAHELRNPLAPIKAAARALGSVDLDAATLARTSDVLSRQVRHMTALVDDLLDVSRVSRGIVTITQSPQEITSIIANAIEQVRPLIDARQHRLLTDIAPNSGYVLGDEKRLIQIHTNLLSNAAKYTPEGGTITLRTHVDEAQISISIEDNGIGIEKALQAGMFELFAQAQRTPDRSQGGLGLGLALVKNLAELHGGTVSCESQGAGHGSTFTVTLPRLAKLAEGSVEAGREDESTTRDATLDILLVDDNVDAIDMLSLLLKAVGHSVRMVYTSASALEAATQLPPDVAILDIGLPDMDGNALARKLKAQPETRHVTLIALTGYGQDQDRKAALDAGFNHYLTKPVDFDELRRLLGQINTVPLQPAT